MNAAFFSSEQQLLAQQLGGYMVLVVPGANGAAPAAFAPLAKQHLPTSSDGTVSRPGLLVGLVVALDRAGAGGAEAQDRRARPALKAAFTTLCRPLPLRLQPT